MSSPSGVSFEQCVSSLAREPCQEKSARELRQGGSDYRCCIPALAGFVSPQSIASDGDELFAKDHHRATVISFRRAPKPFVLVGRNSVEPVSHQEAAVYKPPNQ